MRKHDVIIIGAGPAGSVAAIALASAGVSVCLIEQHRFPRDKVCGECISAQGLAVLDRLHLLPTLQSLHPSVLEKVTLRGPRGDGATIELDKPKWGLSRFLMDVALLGMAAQAGVRILQPARVEEVMPGYPAAIVVRDLVSNELSTIDAPWVLVADGSGALPRARPAPTGDFGVKAHFHKVQGHSGTIELFGFEGFYTGLAPIESGSWNLAVSVPQSILRRYSGDFDALLAAMCKMNPSFAERMRGTNRATRWLAAPLPRFAVARRWEQGVIPLGNAAAALEPIGGQGMGLAMRSAELAAMWIINAGQSSTKDTTPLRQDFARLWHTKRPACRVIAMALSNPRLSSVAVSLTGAGGPLVSWAMRGVTEVE